MNKKQAFMYLATRQQGGEPTPPAGDWITLYEDSNGFDLYYNNDNYTLNINFSEAIPDNITEATFKIEYTGYNPSELNIADYTNEKSIWVEPAGRAGYFKKDADTPLLKFSYTGNSSLYIQCQPTRSKLQIIGNNVTFSSSSFRNLKITKISVKY